MSVILYWRAIHFSVRDFLSTGNPFGLGTLKEKYSALSGATFSTNLSGTGYDHSKVKNPDGSPIGGVEAYTTISGVSATVTGGKMKSVTFSVNFSSGSRSPSSGDSVNSKSISVAGVGVAVNDSSTYTVAVDSATVVITAQCLASNDWTIGGGSGWANVTVTLKI